MAKARLTDLEDAAWRGFLQTHEVLWREVEKRLAAFDVSMAEYSVLALLGEAGPGGMRMTDLAEQRLMSFSGFSRLADRLESRGLIRRQRSATDGRSVDAVLTDAGRRVLTRAWRHHHDDLRELFFDRLEPDDLAHLAAIWQRLSTDASAAGGASS
jgi:DNA-binding MarR family transcriptional regulator